MKLLSDYLTELGSGHNLNFSRQEILRHCIIGLDDMKKKILIVSGIIERRPHHYVIDLNEVSSCSVKKYYGRINVNGLKNRELNHYLEKIVLQFEFHSNKQSAEILIYKRTDNDIRELPELELKAKKWMELLAEISPRSLKKKNLPLKSEK
jgi:hypothetical protein